jgi:hypothetical protein
MYTCDVRPHVYVCVVRLFAGWSKSVRRQVGRLARRRLMMKTRMYSAARALAPAEQPRRRRLSDIVTGRTIEARRPPAERAAATATTAPPTSPFGSVVCLASFVVGFSIFASSAVVGKRIANVTTFRKRMRQCPIPTLHGCRPMLFTVSSVTVAG